jgi:NADPH-dependent 2,4-dienoyl-CoA reductase/sulfur reductase-like enzyme/nitrite reductase/ring-hydroxylating ferredoxin subunit
MPRYTVCAVDDIENGEMKQVEAGDTDVLLIRSHNTFSAVYAYCTHYDAPLEAGVLSDDRVVCPWHHACFHTSTGEQLSPPGMDALPRYPVSIVDGEVVVEVPEDAPARSTPAMVSRDPDDSRTIAIIGAGAAGAYAAEAVRQAGFSGRVVLIGREEDVPYDRPNCSKGFLSGEAPAEWMPLRSAGFYDHHDIDLWLGRDVKTVDASARRIVFSDGQTLDYTAAILSTGGRPRRLDVPGADLDGVHSLRSLADSEHLRDTIEEGSRVVVVGASFIGMEAAWSFREQGAEVTVVAPEAVPFAHVFGEQVGRAIQGLHEDHGVSFRLGTTVDAFHGNDHVEQVTLASGDTLAADLVLVGIGVEPATDLLDGVEVRDDGSVEVDATFRASDGLFAAGDIATFPYWRTGERVRIEHWREACHQGRIAGRNAAGQSAEYRDVPFFWTAHFGTNIRYVGHASDWERVLIDGDPEAFDFIAYYIQNGVVQAACGAGRDREMAAIQELLRRDLMPPPSALERGTVDLAALLQE